MKGVPYGVLFNSMIRISTDSTSDLTRELYKRYNVTVLPLYIRLGGKEYLDGVTLDARLMFELCGKHNELPSTAAHSINDYEEHFNKLREETPGCEIIHVSISSEFSTSFNSARLAAANTTGVYVVDSRNLSSGVGHVVVEAAKRAAEGMPAERIISELENDIIPNVETSFILDRLDYMVKGGRCSMVTALGANLLSLRPCIQVIDGKMKVVKKYRGSFDRCLKQYIAERLDGRENEIRHDRIFVTHAACSPERVSTCVDQVKSYGWFNEVLETSAGCTVSSHCGPNCLGILFIRK